MNQSTRSPEINCDRLCVRSCTWVLRMHTKGKRSAHVELTGRRAKRSKHTAEYQALVRSTEEPIKERWWREEKDLTWVAIVIKDLSMSIIYIWGNKVHLQVSVYLLSQPTTHHSPTHPPIHVTTDICTLVSLYLASYLSPYLPIHPSPIYLSIHHLSICLPFHPSIYPSFIYMPFHPFIHSSCI